MSEELKPCSCGSTDTSICYESPQGYWVECGDCGRQTEKSHGRDLAIAAWSLRAHPAEAEGVERWSELKKLAEKATPGPWVPYCTPRVQAVFGPNGPQPDSKGVVVDWPGFDSSDATSTRRKANAKFISAANPATVLELIAALSAVTAERGRLREVVNTANGFQDALERQRDQLRAEVGRYVPLHEAVQRAADELPEGWAIQLYIERDGGGVELIGPDGTEDFDTNNERLDYTVTDALIAAMAAKEA